MPRPRAACGIYPAYRRHLRDREPIDAACREAQRVHEAGRSSKAAGAPFVVPVPAFDALQRAGAEVNAAIERLAVAAAADEWGDIITLGVQLEQQLDTWCELVDEHTPVAPAS